MWSWSLQCTGRGCVWILITIFFGNIYYNLLSEYLFPFFVWIYITIFVWIVISIFCGNIYYHFVVWIFITTLYVNIYYHFLCEHLLSPGRGLPWSRWWLDTSRRQGSHSWPEKKYDLKKWEICFEEMRNKLTVHWAVQRAPLQGPLQWWPASCIESIRLIEDISLNSAKMQEFVQPLPASAQQRLLSFSPCHLAKHFVLVVVFWETTRSNFTWYYSFKIFWTSYIVRTNHASLWNRLIWQFQKAEQWLGCKMWGFHQKCNLSSHLFLRNSTEMFPSSSWLTTFPFLENLSSCLPSTSTTINISIMVGNNIMVEENIVISLLPTPVPTLQRLTPTYNHAESNLIRGTTLHPPCTRPFFLKSVFNIL